MSFAPPARVEEDYLDFMGRRAEGYTVVDSVAIASLSLMDIEEVEEEMFARVSLRHFNPVVVTAVVMIVPCAVYSAV